MKRGLFMDNELFEQLLHEEESTTLDFKKMQYPFVKAAEHEKAELLKDILGFANAWRRSEAYILIGVEDIRGARAKVIGIKLRDQLADHSLQQFVNNLTNQPVHFCYEAFIYEGKQVGVIRIDEQTRPIYLKRDYGPLKKEQVYVRRGSETNPSKPASIEEIAQMRVGMEQSAAELLVEFADPEKDIVLGTDISLDAEYCKMPPDEEIPGLVRPETQTCFGVELPEIHDMTKQYNIRYFRELAEFEFFRRLCRPTRLVINNIGRIAARRVRLEITVPNNGDLVAFELTDIPDRPKKYYDLYPGIITKNFKGAMHHNHPSSVNITMNNDQYRIDIDFGDLQPGRKIWSEQFYLGIKESGNYSLRGHIYADNLQKPRPILLSISANINTRDFTVNELLSLP